MPGLDETTISTKDLDALHGMPNVVLALDSGQQSRWSQYRGQ